MSPVDVDSLTDRQRARFEEHRGRDFYRYYEAFKTVSATSAPTLDLFDPVAASQHRPRSADDKALTAFCQLTALRLAARRCMLFFFDKDCAYVLAEATRTLSLVDDTHFEAEDGLWLGHVVIPRGLSVCEHTVNIPSANRGSNRNDANAGIVHIINDLANSTTFCNRPFVTASPRARFYAGVPVLSPQGNRIGALCVLDDKPRDGLDDRSVSFMVDMAKTVVDHLEMVREKLQHARGMEMVRGLGAFVERTAYLRQPLSVTSPANAEKPAAGAPPRLLRPYMARGQPAARPDEKSPVRASVPVAEEGHGRGRRSGRAHVGTEGRERPRIDIDQRIHETFQHAAKLVQESIAVDGVAFVDASVTSSTRSAGDRKSGLRARAADSEGLTSTASDCSTDDLPSRQGGKDSVCAVLGSSFDNPSTDDDEERRFGPCPQGLVDRLLRRYPLGKIWNFGETDDSSSSQDDDVGAVATADNDSTPAGGAPEIGPAADQKKRRDSFGHRRRSDRLDARELQRLFPGARSVALIGIWDLSRSRWYAAGFLWTRSRMRVLSQDGEMHYLSAFCDVLMTEIHRIDAQHEGQVKSDFISSLSHELRSPLHGILGTVECLQDAELAQPVSDMVEQVENCGRTLLDVIEHLLDYSVVNNYRTRRTVNDVRRRDSHSRASGAPRDRLRHRGAVAADPSVHLNKITEDVVDATVYSFCYTKNGNAWQSRDVGVHLDIEQLPDAEWHCKLSPGAWRRVCMNIVNNALKYTRKGYIKISLKQSAPETGEHREGRRRYAVFSVTDTGHGMSQDFLENHYFRAFAQEDSFFDGIGLGMSLVAKIVKSLRGQVDVKSEKGVGTSVEVRIPLHLAASEGVNGRDGDDNGNGVDADADGIMTAKPPFEGLAFDFLGSPRRAKTNDDDILKGTRMVFDGTVKTCQKLGARVNVSGRTSRTSEGVAFILEKDFRALHRKGQDSANEADGPRSLSSPLVVLCSSAVSMRSLRASHPELHGSTRFLTQPFGPGKLVKVVTTFRANGNAQDTHPRVVPSTSTSHSASAPLTDLMTPCKAASHAQGCICNSTRISDPTQESATYDTEEVPTRQDSGSFSTDSQPLTKIPSSTSSSADATSRSSESRSGPQTSSSSSSGDGSLGPSKEASSAAKTSSAGATARNLPGGVKGQFESGESTAADALCLQLVDDNSINLQILTAFSRKNGYTSIKSDNGAKAVDAYIHAAQNQATSTTADAEACKVKPHVILMDINMPVMNGFEATRRIRAYERQQQKVWQKEGGALRPALIIALTGLSSEDAMREGQASGMDMFLTKPVRLQELKKILSGVDHAPITKRIGSVEDGKNAAN